MVQVIYLDAEQTLLEQYLSILIPRSSKHIECYLVTLNIPFDIILSMSNIFIQNTCTRYRLSLGE